MIKRKLYNLDLKRSILNQDYIILNFRSIPKRTSFSALIIYENGLFSYIISAENVVKGKFYKNKLFENKNLGNYCILNQIPYGISIYNLEIKLGYGSQFSRAAGSYSKIISKFTNKFNKLIIQLKSSEQYLINSIVSHH